MCLLEKLDSKGVGGSSGVDDRYCNSDWSDAVGSSQLRFKFYRSVWKRCMELNWLSRLVSDVVDLVGAMDNYFLTYYWVYLREAS